jgi:hypothetical protein
MPTDRNAFSNAQALSAPGTYGPALQPKPPAVKPPADLLKPTSLANGASALRPKKPQADLGKTTQSLPGAGKQGNALDAVRHVLTTFDERRKQAALGERFGLVEYTQHWLRGRRRKEAAEQNAVLNFVKTRVG